MKWTIRIEPTPDGNAPVAPPVCVWSAAGVGRSMMFGQNVYIVTCPERVGQLKDKPH
jgi:hypothetical protein